MTDEEFYNYVKNEWYGDYDIDDIDETTLVITITGPAMKQEAVEFMMYNYPDCAGIQFIGATHSLRNRQTNNQLCGNSKKTYLSHFDDRPDLYFGGGGPGETPYYKKSNGSLNLNNPAIQITGSQLAFGGSITVDWSEQYARKLRVNASRYSTHRWCYLYGPSHIYENIFKFYITVFGLFANFNGGDNSRGYLFPICGSVNYERYRISANKNTGVLTIQLA